MQSLALDVRVLDENGNQVELKDTSEYDVPANINQIEFNDKRDRDDSLDGSDRGYNDSDEFFDHDTGFTELDENGEEVEIPENEDDFMSLGEEVFEQEVYEDDFANDDPYLA